MKINFKIAAALLMMVAVSFGCKKSYLDTNPTSEVSKNEMFKTTGGAYTALNGLHSFMLSTNDYNDLHDNFGAKAICLDNDMMGNDMVGQPTGYDWFNYYYTYVTTESASYRMTQEVWLFYYRIVNNANAIIENIDGAEGPQEERDDIKGQALAYRTWAYLGLIAHYQHTYAFNHNAPGLPIYTKATTPETIGTGRGTLQDNIDMMTADISEAVTLLANAPDHSGNKSMISEATAKGIYARLALIKHDWTTAKSMAIDAMLDYPLMSNDDLLGGMNNANNPEWMWASNYTAEQYNGNSIVSFISFMDADCPGYASVGATRSITKSLYDEMSATDVRRGWFNGDMTQRKFRAQFPSGFVADLCYMRSAEMYLILAEADAELNQLSDAKQILEDMVTTRDPNYTVTATTKTDILEAIYLQRRIELWGDGFGYLDIVRLQKPLDRSIAPGDHVLGVCQVAHIPPNDEQFLWKIPQRELDVNPNIGPEDQN